MTRITATKDKSWKREKISSIVSSTPENSTISMLVENGHAGSKSKENGLLRNGGAALYTGEPEVVYECQEQAIKASFGHQDVSQANVSEFETKIADLYS
jgi:hypothetical protein